MYVSTSIGDFIVCILNMCLHVRQHVPFSLLVRSQKYVLTCTRDSGLPYFKAQNACLVHCQYMSSLFTRDFGPPYRRLSEDVRAQVPVVVVVVVCFFDFCLLITIMTMVNLSAHWWDNQEAQVSPAHWGRKKTPSQKVRTSSLSKCKII